MMCRWLQTDHSFRIRSYDNKIVPVFFFLNYPLPECSLNIRMCPWQVIHSRKNTLALLLDVLFLLRCFIIKDGPDHSAWYLQPTSRAFSMRPSTRTRIEIIPWIGARWRTQRGVQRAQINVAAFAEDWVQDHCESRECGVLHKAGGMIPRDLILKDRQQYLGKYDTEQHHQPNCILWTTTRYIATSHNISMNLPTSNNSSEVLITTNGL